MILIAEAGNCHFGDMDRAKEMIKIAKDCGADLVKFQAIEAEFVKPYGSMPEEFYDHVAMDIEEYKELIDAGNNIGIPVFFSAFGHKVKEIFAHTFYHKVSAKQSPIWQFTEWMDKDSTFVSVNPDYGTPPELEKAKLLYATKYLPLSVDWEAFNSVCDYYERQIGYSDHSVGIENCLKAVNEYGADVVEKHFSLTRNLSWEGVQFRDAIHSALPKELENLARRIK